VTAEELARHLDLSKYHSRLLFALTSRAFIAHEMALEAMYFDKRGDPPNDHMVQAHISGLRKAIQKKYGIKILTERGGYSISDPDKGKLMDILELKLNGKLKLPETVHKVRFVIEKDIPFPTTIKSKYPLTEMEVGDSFATTATRHAIHHAVKRARRLQPGRDWRARQVVGGLRVWRIK